MLPPEDHILTGSEEEIEKKLKRLSSIGKPLDDVEVRIVRAQPTAPLLTDVAAKANGGTVTARHVIVATNGYTGKATPWLQRRVIPIPPGCPG